MKPDAFATVVESCIKQALAPLVARLGVLEAERVAADAVAANITAAFNDLVALQGGRLAALEAQASTREEAIPELAASAEEKARRLH